MTAPTKTMSVQQALRELALTTKKVEDVLADTVFVRAIPANQSTVAGKTISEYERDTTADWNRVTALVSLRDEIKRAVNQSNAVTTVVIGGKTLTVAQAIARKELIVTDKVVLNHLSSQIVRAQKEAEKMEASLQAQATEAATRLYGDKDKGGNAAEFEKFVTQYLEQRKPVFAGLADAVKLRDALKADIDSFEAEVDWKLTESNVTTLITINV